MKVKCSSCGKVFEIPKSQDGKMLRCLCRALFRAKAIEETAQDISEIAQITDPDETVETKRTTNISFQKQNENTESNQEPESTISEQELDSYLSNLKKSRSEAPDRQSDIKPKSTGPHFQKDQPSQIFEIQSLELSNPLPENKEEQNENRISSVQEKVAQETDPFRTPTKSTSPKPKVVLKVVWYKDFRVLAASFAMLLITVVSALTLMSKTEEKKVEDPYLTKLLTPKNLPTTVVEHPKESARIESPNSTPPSNPSPQTPTAIEQNSAKTIAPPPAKEIAVARGPSLYEKLQKEFFEGRFENVIRLASSAKDLSPEERALHFEALVQRANDNRSRLQEIKNQIIEERKRTQSAVYVRSLTAAVIFSATDTKELIQSIEALKNLALTRSQDPLVFMYLGFAYHEIGRADLMNQAWNDSMNLAPGFIWLMEQRIDQFLSSENYARATEMAERLRKISGKEQHGLLRLAKIALAQKKEDEAIKYYREALKIQEDPAIHLAIGQYYFNKNIKIALNEFDAGLKLDPDTLTKRDLYFQKGKAHCKEKNLKEAVISFNRATSLDNHYYQAHFEKGNCQLLSNQAGAAAESFEAALGQNPNNSTIWMTYGYTLLRLSKARAAVGALKRSLEIKESDKAHYYMALALIQLGRRQEGIAHAKQAYKLNPKNNEARTLASRGH